MFWQITAVGGFIANNNNPLLGVHRAEVFQPPNQVEPFYYPNLNLMLPRKKLRSSLYVEPPSMMPQQEFTGLTKSQRRSLAHTNDMFIIREGRQYLTVGYWQSNYKVASHGHVHGLEYTLRPDGTKITKRTDENTFKMMHSVLNMVDRDTVISVEDGTYQIEEGMDAVEKARGFDAIHLYDKEERIIAVFKKSTGKFVTTCELTETEAAAFLKTGNFGGKPGWAERILGIPFSPQQSELKENDIPRLPSISSTNNNLSSDFTPVNSFENDILGITPTDEFNK